MKRILSVCIAVIFLLTALPLCVSAEETHQEGYLYYSIENGVATVADCSDWAQGNLDISAYVLGYPVVAIGDSAFKNKTNVASVSIPNTVQLIGAYAFSGCKSLTYVDVPDTVWDIGDYAFQGCSSLATVNIPEGVTRINKGTFSGCGLKSIHIPNSVLSIGQKAFENCYKLSSINVGENVAVIERSAFINSGSYTSVTIPDSVVSIGASAFSPCTIQKLILGKGLQSVDKDAFYEVESVYVEDLSVLNAIGGLSLSQYPYKTMYDLYIKEQLVTDLVIPEGMAELNGCFKYCKSIVNVTIPGSVTSIGERLFYGCENLTKVSISKEVSSIGEYAFYGTNVTDVWYNGTLEQRNNIELVAGNDILLNATWHFESCNGHEYDGRCDDTCNTCGWVRYVPAHSYDDAFDPDCNVCGLTRPVPTEGTPYFMVDTTEVMAGNTFTVAVRIGNNPGIASMNLRVHYDSKVLTLQSVKANAFSDVVFGPTSASPLGINWVDGLSGDNTTNGVVATLTFSVAEDAALGNTPVAITYTEGSVFDSNLEDVPFATIDGVVHVTKRPSGDADGDGSVTVKDLSKLQRYLAGWKEVVNERDSDVNDDGWVNNRDLMLLQRYLAGWDVELG